LKISTAAVDIIWQRGFMLCADLRLRATAEQYT
jgi:hypothetical protein